ncbi:hypothetical protein [Aquimarina algiphila]|uniref:hypothetical protein n=1 Tax=Aquimarina algiphila TaxID=2047982 RepID=UPI0023309E50|nr:hypothetical protein [Aquimarina algiphila]
MKKLELNISKVLIDQITVDEFESIIYQEYYVEKMESNDFIAKVITINYRDESWKNELEKLICNLWDDTKYLTYLIRNYCLKIIESEDLKKILSAVNEIERLNNRYDYEYGTLLQFYRFVDELDYISCGYGWRSKEAVILEIKSYTKLYLDIYNLNTDHQVLLNLNLTENSIKTANQNQSDFSEKISKSKKWFQFWK